MPVAGLFRTELVPMVTYSELFTFIIYAMCSDNSCSISCNMKTHRKSQIKNKDFSKTEVLESARRDSNPRPRPWQGRAPPTEPLAHNTLFRKTCASHAG